MNNPPENGSNGAMVSQHSDGISIDTPDNVSGGELRDEELIESLGITPLPEEGISTKDQNIAKAEDDAGYEIVPDPNAEAVDLSTLRGVAKNKDKTDARNLPAKQSQVSTNDLDALEELVPNVKGRRHNSADILEEGEENLVAQEETNEGEKKKAERRGTGHSGSSNMARNLETSVNAIRAELANVEIDVDADIEGEEAVAPSGVKEGDEAEDYNAEDEASSSGGGSDMYDGLDGNESDGAKNEEVPQEFMNMSSGQSLSTATQTHEVRMPMYLPTFKPATGCTNASDFIVRCFVARLRSGITVVKHGRSRWCKSRLRILHIHQDGCSLSWKPAEGEPTSSKRPPKLDLTQCEEVRHAWSPDPNNPMYTGTSILRQKCEAANAHKSFALIFPKRTVDITAVTADQCKVLMEGFSALCFRLQVADLAAKSSRKGNEEEVVSSNGSVAMTQSSQTRS